MFYNLGLPESWEPRREHTAYGVTFQNSVARMSTTAKKYWANVKDIYHRSKEKLGNLFPVSPNNVSVNECLIYEAWVC
jgi:hypothetical protein